MNKNRTVSNEPQKYCQTSKLENPNAGRIIHLRAFE
jgi:hypothetical protein